MKNLIVYFALAMMHLIVQNLSAQEIDQNKIEDQIKTLELRKERILEEEREALKNEVMVIEERLKNKEITADKAQSLKEAAAKRHALNIENRVAIIDNQIALLKRNGLEASKKNIGVAEIELENDDDEENRLLGIKFKNRVKKRRYDRRTYSDFILAIGFNNAIQDGVSFNDSDFRFGGSRFWEFGWAWRTRIFDHSNFLRVKYGLSFQFNNLKPTDNRFFVDQDGETILQTSDFELDRSKIRFSNLVFPIHLEFGPSSVKETENYIRYSTRRKFKVGVGAYVGFNIGTRQRLVFDNENGDRVRERTRADFNRNNLVYGLSSYIGWGSKSLYIKYDLNPVFNDNQPEIRNISLGIRFDFY